MIARYRPVLAPPIDSDPDTCEIARDYLQVGWQPVPVPRGQKAPILTGWQSLDINESNIDDYFGHGPQNIGVQLGGRSGGLADIDLDSPEALTIANTVLPRTDAIFGRQSKPCSHFLYVTDLHTTEQRATLQFVEPRALSDGRPVTLVELRVGGGDKGAQTVFPGSVHPSGEAVRWDQHGAPAVVSGPNLVKAVAVVASGALLARHYPPEGQRHEAALVLGGVLARIPATTIDEIKTFVSAVARCAGDEEAEERGQSAAGAVELLRRGQPTPGVPRMREVWGVDVTKTAVKWLGVEGTSCISDDEIDRLARLDTLSYEGERNEAASRLGFRVSVLDRLVHERQQVHQPRGSGEFLVPVEPWPEEVEGDQLILDLFDVFDRHVVLSAHACLACALWTLHAHAHNAATHSPILDVSSPTKRCGKTQLLATIALLVPAPLSAANVTPATVFRAIDVWRPTLLVDEVDTFLSDKPDLRGILNSGHNKSGAYVLRCVGDDLVPKQFSTWCAKVFAHIGRVNPTLEDRSVRITLRRRLKSERIERIPRHDPYLDFRRKCARWAVDHLEELEQAEPNLPDSLNDRASDNWRPLLAIAESCGCEREARTAAVELSQTDDDETDSIVLLGDLKSMFEREKNEHPSAVAMSSTDIVTQLASIEERKWPEYRGGRPITATQLAALLRPFNVRPRKVQDSARERQVQGYRFDQFDSTFGRYLGQTTP